ncbi:MAG TPA: TraR/DksA C4-type zinc finger protein [Acidimicrobiales bacterium]|nr:TraR/DksA C4-type zinc finger protein [Acidimicrobiales bacterium]
MTVSHHRRRLDDLRAATESRISRLTADYDALAEAGTDVGSGDDEGGSESDGTFVERDRIRAQIQEDQELLDQIEAATERSRTKAWRLCTRCSEPIGEARLEALPTTTVCVSCKASGTSW